jgi:hypothetical protein
MRLQVSVNIWQADKYEQSKRDMVDMVDMVYGGYDECDVLVRGKWKWKWKFTLMASKNKVAALRERLTLFIVTTGPRSWHESAWFVPIAGLSTCRRIGEAVNFEGQLTKY